MQLRTGEQDLAVSLCTCMRSALATVKSVAAHVNREGSQESSYIEDTTNETNDVKMTLFKNEFRENTECFEKAITKTSQNNHPKNRHPYFDMFVNIFILIKFSSYYINNVS